MATFYVYNGGEYRGFGQNLRSVVHVREGGKAYEIDERLVSHPVDLNDLRSVYIGQGGTAYIEDKQYSWR